MAQPTETLQIDQNEAENGVKAKTARVREEIPEYDDPTAELAKLPSDLVKPDRTNLDATINKLQGIIDAEKRKVERFSKDMDSIKLANAKRKQEGSGEMELVRSKLRDIKSSIVASIEEKKKINAEIEAVRSQKRAMDDQVKAARMSVGGLKSNEAIDEEIARVQETLHHTTISIKEEKACILRIKELEASRSSVVQLEKLETAHKNTKFQDTPALYEARNAKDEVINALKLKESAQVEILDALKAKREKEISGNNFSELFDARNACRDLMTVNINKIKELRDEFRKEEDAFYKTDRLIRELKKQISKKNRAKKEADRQAWIEKNGEEGAAPLEEEDEEDENGEKTMDWEIADRIAICGQLITFLEGYKPKTVTKTDITKKAAPVLPEGARAKGMSGAAAMDDPLGLNAFMVDEAVSNKKNKKDKKKAKNQAKNSKVPQAGEVISLDLSLDVMHQFNLLSLPTPIDTNDVDDSINHLTEKKAYYEEKGKTGIKLKDLIKEEKEARKAAKTAQSGAAEAAATAEAEAAAAAAKAEEEALAKIKAAEEAEFQRKKEEAAAAAAAQAKREADLAAAEAAAAEEAANEAMLAAEEKAKQKALAEKQREKERLEAEKKAASPKTSPKIAPKSPKSPDPIDDKFEEFMKAQGLDEEDEEEEDEGWLKASISKTGLKVQLQLKPDGTIGASISQLDI